jgi:hypothetical protein
VLGATHKASASRRTHPYLHARGPASDTDDRDYLIDQALRSLKTVTRRTRRSSLESTPELHQQSGWVAPGFEEVRLEFERNFAERDEIGAAVAAYWRGEKVADLWGGAVPRVATNRGTRTRWSC